MLSYNSYNCDHSLNNVLSRYKVSSEQLRNTSIVTTNVNTERFKITFFNRLVLKHNLDVLILDFRVFNLIYLLSYSAKAMAKNFKSSMYRKTQGTSKVATVASCPGHEYEHELYEKIH